MNKKLDIITPERLNKDDQIVEGSAPDRSSVASTSGESTKVLRVDAPSLIEILYERGVFGPKDTRELLAERRRDNGFWLMELYEFLYHSEGVARYEPFSGGAKGYGAEMSDAEAELRALYHRYLRALPAAMTQSLRFLCKDQQLPRVQTVPIADCLDQLDTWREKERRERQG